MSSHREISFEDEVYQYLSKYAWLYSDGDADAYDRVRALFEEHGSSGLSP